jgi:hypothetical protein
LFFDSVLHSVFELSLNGLRCAQDISELLRDCLVHQLLDPLFWLILHRAVLTHIYVFFHVIQEVFDCFLPFTIVLNQSVHVLRFD